MLSTRFFIYKDQFYQQQKFDLYSAFHLGHYGFFFGREIIRYECGCCQTYLTLIDNSYERIDML